GVSTAGKDRYYPFILGAYAGGGFSFSYSPNVTNPAQLLNGDPEDTTNVNGPIVSVSASGEGTDSATYTGSGGRKGLASVSRYPTRTIGTAYSYSTIASNIQSGAARVGSVSSAVIQQLQARVASLTAQVAALVASYKTSK